ncbi:hypothetical protein O181_061283 [Austropuccinia psidii MF-1]|uniref:Uncharacterized protein n=1 Tax=Austropuccinia psidii MF-1 TaxID=1389203 RepID=A0A9Q3EHT4_9BASI|nr:hypothetical protein [Austropuccinia psidii MF-1]
MSSTTLSHSNQSDSNVRKKRSNQHSNNLNLLKNLKNFSTPKWKLRSKKSLNNYLTPDQERQAFELLKKFNGRKDFSLPIELPPWSPSKEPDEITSDLKWFRDYTITSPSLEIDKVHPPNHDRLKSSSSSILDSNQNGLESSQSLPFSSNHHHDHLVLHQNSKRSSPITTGISTNLPVPSSSASPGTYSSPPDPPPPSKNLMKKRISIDKKIESSDLLDSKATLDRHPSPFKGKEKAQVEIDWTGWGPQNYLPEQLGHVRHQYEQRAKELKRLSDGQRHQIALAKTSNDQSSIFPEGLDTILNLATIEIVDSLLLFTQSFLCFDLARLANNGSTNRLEYYSQWESMMGFLSVAKATARRSGIDLAFAICLMYESLLLDRLTDAERPMLLQSFSHTSDPDKQAEGIKRFTKLLNNQEQSKSSWSMADSIFQKIISLSPSRSTAKNFALPKLKSLMAQMKLRGRKTSPKILSLDRPWRFCWPIDKSNLDSMADFVVFARAALDEWVEISGSSYRLAKFDDLGSLFPSSYNKKD